MDMECILLPNVRNLDRRNLKYHESTCLSPDPESSCLIQVGGDPQVRVGCPGRGYLKASRKN